MMLVHFIKQEPFLNFIQFILSPKDYAYSFPFFNDFSILKLEFLLIQ